MRQGSGRWQGLGMVLGLSASLWAQEPESTQDPGPQDKPPEILHYLGYTDGKVDGDAVELLFSKGLRCRLGGTELRAESMVLRIDREAYYRLTNTRSRDGERIGVIRPKSRRLLRPELLAQRFASFLEAVTGGEKHDLRAYRQWLGVVRSVYLEGQIVLIQDGVETLRAASLMLAVPENRMVLKDCNLRLISPQENAADQVLVIRAPKLVKQGPRFHGRDVSLTTCTAGEPHFEIKVSQLEVIERGHQFEVFGRGNSLAFSGNTWLPLPDAHFYTGQDPQIPIKGFRAGYSEAEGVEMRLLLGNSYNDLGGAIHEFLTGRDASEFRGDWRLGLGYNELRGQPVDLDLTYEVEDLYEGRLRSFYLDNDGGPNREYIRTDLAGNTLTEKDRSMVHTVNRFELWKNWRLDLSLFAAGDEAVWSEFYRGNHYDEEIPETSAHLRWADGNKLMTLTGRTNLNSWSYGDDRFLAPSFVNEAPVLTFDWFSEPLLEMGPADLLLTSATTVGWLHREFDPLFPSPVKDRTFRFDQELELSAPFQMGPVALRPYSSNRVTHYDDTVDGTSKERWVFDAGISATTRLHRTWSWGKEDGSTVLVRHSMYPQVSFGYTYQADGDVADYHQFDEIDALHEQGVVRVGLVNRFEQVVRGRGADEKIPHAYVPEGRLGVDDFVPPSKTAGEAREFLFLDVAQNFFPIDDRDNAGHNLGLFEYEAIWRPMSDWVPVPNLRVLVEGEHDWNENRLRTFNSALRFGKVLGAHWYGGYRTDTLVRGTAHYGLSTDVLGRWLIAGSGAYDLDRKEQLDYGLGLTRRDHDWLIRIGLSYSIVRDETSFSVNFEPLFGGLFRRRPRDFAGSYGRGPDAILGY